MRYHDCPDSICPKKGGAFQFVGYHSFSLLFVEGYRKIMMKNVDKALKI
jgi:hypothetical protein